MLTLPIAFIFFFPSFCLSSSLRFRVNVAQPDALLEATLFLKSGAGWYGAAFTLPHDGIHTLQLPLSDFKAEGSPAGWDRIEGLRLAFWPRDIGASRLVPLSLDAVKDSVWIVDGLARAKTADDRTIANAARAQVEKLLRDLGIPFARVPGDRIRDARGAKVLILPHNPNLSAADVAELTSQVKAGSRLLVFQNENKELAALMGVRLGELQLSSTVGRFDRWAFPENRETGFPRRLYQHAWAFPDIRPGGGGTRVLAQWTNAQDQSSGAIAMLGHANGFWMSHPWRSADTAGKRQTLFAMLARLHPEIARHAVHQARDSGSVRAFQLRYGVLPARSRPAQVMRQVAEDRVARTLSWIQQGRWAEAWWEDQALFQLLEKAYASSRQAWRGDMVGIWDQQGTGVFAGGWDETCRALKAAGFPGQVSNIDCTEHPCLVFGTGFGRSGDMEKLKGLLGPYENDALSTYGFLSGASGAEQRSFGVAVMPKGDGPPDEAMEKRITYRVHQLYEASASPSVPLP
jgi:hypothetical protein